MVARTMRGRILFAIAWGACTIACSGKSIGRSSDGEDGGTSGAGGTMGGGETGGGAGTGHAIEPPACGEAYECPEMNGCDPATGSCVPACGGKVFDQGSQRPLEPVVPCPDDQICVEQYLSTYTSAGACFTPCETGVCPEGFSCVASLCRRAGDGGPGEACEGGSTWTSCRPDTLCFQGECRERCDYWSADPGCPAREACWNGLALGGADDSMCITPDSSVSGTDEAAVGEPCAEDHAYRDCGNDGKAWRGSCDTPCPFGCSDCTGPNCGPAPLCVPVCRTLADCPNDLPYCHSGRCAVEGPPGIQ